MLDASWATGFTHFTSKPFVKRSRDGIGVAGAASQPATDTEIDPVTHSSGSTRQQTGIVAK